MNLNEIKKQYDHLDERNEQVGIPINYLLFHLDETFSKSSDKLLADYLDSYSDVKKWIIVSDYVIGDKKKPNDTVVFSIIPGDVDIEKIFSTIDRMAPVDIKKTREVSGEFLEFLSNGPVFNICIKLNKNRKLHSDERSYHNAKINSIIAQLEIWCRTTPERQSDYIQSIKKLKAVQKIINSPAPNYKQFRDIEVVSTLAAYFMAKITSRINTKLIGWFSDRDAMLSFKHDKIGNYLFTCTEYLHYTITLNSQNEYHGEITFGVPEAEGKMWYDSLIRIPDLLAGTFADYDYKDNKLTHDKYVPVVENLFTAEKRNIFFRLDFIPKPESARLTWQKQSDISDGIESPNRLLCQFK
ncbi:hypothetical protein [Pseudomonas sp. BN607]|uniref:hypothetical protein n=1 Tax=Pseudomonas sp. BN607 TaxID=2567895 RepID=UPI0024569FFE|nr:hypothetical protein [Pseudomonas sp. BN607]MDH4552735.1 hypothetical protein [Pseudomonas sp. BN607]